MENQDATKICAVCGVSNNHKNQQCINCNSFLPEDSKSDITSGKNIVLKPKVIYLNDYTPGGKTNKTAVIGKDHSSSPTSVWFKLFLLAVTAVSFFAGLLKSISDWMLLSFILALFSFTAGLIYPALIIKNKPRRSTVVRKMLPVLIIFFILYGVASHISSPIFSTSEPVPAITYSSDEKAGKDYTWKYDGRMFNWHVEVSKELLEYDRKMNAQIKTFFGANSYTQKMMYDSSSVDFKRIIQTLSKNSKQDYNVWVKDDANDQWVASLAQQLDQTAKANGYDSFNEAEFILSFVGSAIPYEISRYPQLAAQTAFDNGDCEDKSILLAGLLYHLDYRVAMLYFAGTSTKPGHMAVGVAFEESQVPPRKDLSYYEYNGHKYYFAETTAPNWPLGKASLEKPADILVIE